VGGHWKLHTLYLVLLVIVLTAAGAAVGASIHGVTGAVIGGIPAALAAVAAGFTPVMRDRAERRRAERLRAEADFARIADPIQELDEQSSVALLSPDRAVVEFTGRADELETLREWLYLKQSRSVRALVGAGGTGKTRLALHVAAEWAAECKAQRAVWRLVAAGQEENAVAAARQVASGPLLLIVDYAETRGALQAMLRAVLDDPGPIRILLIARRLGEWWDRLVEESPRAIFRLLKAGEAIRLNAPITSDVSDAEIVVAALPYFARALQKPVPKLVRFEVPASRAPVLVLHAAALVAVLRFSVDPAAPLRVVAGEVVDELLVHEARYWRRTAKAAGLTDDGPVVKAVVAAVAVIGAASHEEAEKVVIRVPVLFGMSAAEQARWARWLYDLYPGSQDRLGTLQPDLIAEAHVACQLASDRRLAKACMRGLSDAQAEHALTLLARAWVHNDNAGELIATALRDDLPNLAFAAARVAVQTNSEMGRLLADALRDAPASLDMMKIMARLALVLPYPSAALAQPYLIAVTRTRDALVDDAEPKMRAQWAVRAATAWLQVGHPMQAVPLCQEAVTIYGQVVAVDSGCRNELQVALSNLSTSLSEAGRDDDALAATREAVAITRELAQEDPEEYRTSLAVHLSNLGLWLLELGRAAEALPVIQEAVAIHRELASAASYRYRDSMGNALTNLGIAFAELDQVAEALPVTRQAADIFAELAAADPDSYGPDLARTLINLGLWLLRLGRLQESADVSQEAVSAYRRLITINPNRYRPELADALINLGVALPALGRPADALIAVQEAVGIRHELAAINPDRQKPKLASALSHLADLMADLGQPADALPVTQEAVAAFRELTVRNPDRYRPDLARDIMKLGNVFLALDRPADGISVYDEAIFIYRDLAADSATHRNTLAAVLSNLGVAFAELGRTAEALSVTQEAVAILRELAASDPDRRTELANMLANLCGRLIDLDRIDEARTVIAEAADIYPRAEAGTQNYNGQDVAQSLTKFGALCYKTSYPSQALQFFRDAAAIYRALAATSPDRYLVPLREAVSNIARTLVEQGSFDFLPALEEMVAISRKMAASDPENHRPGLVDALNHLADIHSALGNDSAAESARAEAASLGP